MPNEDDTENDDPTEQESRVQRSTALDRLNQKRLAVKLRMHAEEIMRESADVPICDEQDELISDAASLLFDAGEAVWPGDEMPRLEEIRQGEWDDQS